MAEEGTLVFDAQDKVLGRLASHVASTLLVTRREGDPKRVIIINAEKAIVTGAKDRILADYDRKYKLNHPRKGPFFPRMPAASILERAPALTLYAATLGEPMMSPLPRSLPGTRIVSSSPAVLDSRLKFGSAQLLRLASSLSATSRHNAAPVDLLCAFRSPIKAIKASLVFLLLLLI